MIKLSKSKVSIPLWLDHSGLPGLLRDETKSPIAWFLFKHLVQLDCETNPQPGVVECPILEFSEHTGIEPKAVLSTLKKLRKQSLIRCFLPDHEEEVALIQLLCPLQTPISWKQLQREHPKFQGLLEHEFRYATQQSAAEFATDQLKQTKFQQVLELYLNLVSMKINQFVQDEIALIAEFYEYKLVQKIFLQARQKEIQNLGWIIRQIREENLQKKKLLEAQEKASESNTASSNPTESDSGW